MYFLVENGQASPPYTLDDLKTKIIYEDDYVCHGFNNQWVRAKDLPELASIIRRRDPDPNPIPRERPRNFPSAPSIVIGKKKVVWSAGAIVLGALLFLFYLKIENDKKDFIREGLTHKIDSLENKQGEFLKNIQTLEDEIKKDNMSMTSVQNNLAKIDSMITAYENDLGHGRYPSSVIIDAITDCTEARTEAQRDSTTLGDQIAKKREAVAQQNRTLEQVNVEIQKYKQQLSSQ